MSLRAWYVLNGNVKNQGLGDFELTQVTAPTYAQGKLCPQALNGGAFKWVASQTSKILNNNELSYSAWIYVGEADTRSMIFGTDVTPRRFCLFQYPTKNDFHWSWGQDDTGNNWAGVATGALPTGKWTHIAFAYKYGSAKVYVNGVQVDSGIPKVNITSYSLDFNVIINNTNHRLQDIRIYDHCLSLKEIKELSKGLCLHYKLDDTYSTGASQTNASDVADCSGINHKHLSNSGVCALVTSSPVYERAYNFNQAGYCYNNSVPITLQEFTISFWVNPHSNANQAQHFLFGTFDSWTGNGIGMYRDVNKNNYAIVFRVAEESSYTSHGVTLDLNTWSLITLVWDGTNYKLYKNGTQAATKTYGSNGNCLFKNIYLGNSMFNTHPASETEDASMSDFRVYAKALTDADILELYQTRMSIDNKKNVFTYYLKET